ncbi:MAG: transketolase [Candidatus Parcubacteria bacterium]|nr:MAG: transketolase [Candidatus Parcubacteria bacterium]
MAPIPSFPLHPGVFDPARRELAPTRDGFGYGVVEAGEENPKVVVLCADLAESTRAAWFQERFPDRYIEVGVAEQNLAAVASGMAAEGLVPFIASYAAFSPGRNWEQIRTTIALNNQPVKVCGMHAGVSVGPDGATHQALEDIATMRVIPNMTVIAPADAEEARKAVVAAARYSKPVYLRFAREKTPVVTLPETPFEIGTAYVAWDAVTPEVVLASTGNMLFFALDAAQELERQGIAARVLHIPTVKPLDAKTILEAARGARGVVSIEEHQVAGGLGSALAELFAQKHPVSMRFIGVQDRFGQSGRPEELFREYQLTPPDIVRAAQSLLAH